MIITTLTDKSLDRRITSLENAMVPGIKAVIRASITRLSMSLQAADAEDATNADKEAFRKSWMKRVTGEYAPQVVDTYVTAGEDVQLQLIDNYDGPASDVPFIAQSDAVEYLSTAINRMFDVSNSVWNYARSQMMAGISAGESVDEIAQRLLDSTTWSAQRAALVARTEILSARNGGAMAAMSAAGQDDAKKTWLATEDERTRETHAKANGQTVSFLSFFQVGSSQLDFPGDPLGAADEVINCRCTVQFELSPNALSVNIHELPDVTDEFDPADFIDLEDLVATGATDTPFSEANVKRDGKGRFAKKAGKKVAAPNVPGKKTAASTSPPPPAPTGMSTPGKKMTNAVIYGKHPHGTTITSSDGQHRMVYSANSNKWEMQERDASGVYKTTGTLGKAAAYKRANEVSGSWGPPVSDNTQNNFDTATALANLNTPSASTATPAKKIAAKKVASAPSTPSPALAPAPSSAPSLPTPASSSPPIGHSPGTHVQTPYGPGTVVSSMETSPGGTQLSIVEMDSGGEVVVPVGYVHPTPAKKTAAKKTSVSVPTPTIAPSPPTAPPVTPPAPGGGLSAKDKTAIVNGFKSAGVAWYSKTNAIYDQAVAIQKANPHLSIAQILEHADSTTTTSKFGGSPFTAKVEKWGMSAAGKKHIQSNPPGHAAVTPTTPASPAPTPGISAPPGVTIAVGAKVNGPKGPATIMQVKQFSSGKTYVDIDYDDPNVLGSLLSPESLSPYTPSSTTSGTSANPLTSTTPNTNALTPSSETQVMAPGYTPPAAGAWPHPGLMPVDPAYPTMLRTTAIAMQARMTTPPQGEPLTATQRDALRYYTDHHYKKMNRCLRANIGCTPALNGRNNAAIAGMRPTTDPITTFRGASFAALGVNNLSQLRVAAAQGATAHDDGFVSTSSSPTGSFSGDVKIQFEVPAGTPASYVAAISHYPSENELLLAPGTRYRILELDETTSPPRVRVEVIPS